ncbi:unnamed protein product [Blepharisma stoltei]|uniref:Uncharacterized protein n=1 Tax=Blepharisma stoltei TaxID=1481888 RepID=A0AAU9IYD5_9CILI|nr:unnamed protein product [Blepharisma stoltei]
MFFRLCLMCFKGEDPNKASQRQNNSEPKSSAPVNMQKDVEKSLANEKDNRIINDNPSNSSISSSFVSESISSGEKSPITTPTPNNGTKSNQVRKLTGGFQRAKYKKNNGKS